MPDLLVRSFAPFLLAFQPCFTRPGFSSFWALTCAWILCAGRRSLTRVIQSGELGRFKHFCSFHRFFSQARWNLDDLGLCILQLLLPFCPEVLTGAVDDTLARKSGRHIWGAGMHHDPRALPRNGPSFLSAIAGSFSPCMSRFPSLPKKRGHCPSSSASIANGRTRNWLPAAMESRRRNRPGRRPTSNIELARNWLWK
jgi:hypothetical protein